MLISDIYPVIILDEFQDTNLDEWNLIQALGISSRLISLADPDQRIYEFRGASPTRIPDFHEAFHPEPFDFSTDNHRSSGTDICTFGKDLLTGANKGKKYNQVRVHGYQFRKGSGLHLDLKTAVIARRKELLSTGKKDWSLAILVPTKSLMLNVSEYLDATQTFIGGGKAPSVGHNVAIESAGPALAATVIAGVLDGGDSAIAIAQSLIRDLCNHIRGRKGGESPNQQQMEMADALGNFLESGTIRGKRRTAVADGCRRIGEMRMETELTGDPERDWLNVRKWFLDATAPELQQVGFDARFLKFLHKGSVLRAKLAEIWRFKGGYQGASRVVHEALLQEHFSTTSQVFRGIHVMTIHKSKGKEFDEVIIYEGVFQGRILRAGASVRDRAQALLSLRVGVTRAMKFTNIFTPRRDPCPFL